MAAVSFSGVVLDVDRVQLLRDGDEVAVEPQVFEVLAYLVAHRDRMVPKTELLDEVWGDRFVSESALTSRIKSARRAIGDNGRDQRLIRTVHGRGFRFVGEVSESTGGAPAPAEVRTADHGRASADAGAIGGDVVARLLAGRGVVVEVVGPSARSRADALDDIVHAASAAGFLVGRGGAGELRRHAGVLGAVEEWVERDPGLLGRIPDGCAREIGMLVGDETGGATVSRPRLHLAVRELIAAAGAAGGGAARGGARGGAGGGATGALLAIDDVHLIDRDTLDLLDQIARAARRLPVGLVVSHRPGFAVVDDAVLVTVDDPGAEVESIPASIRRTVARLAVLGEVATHEEAVAATGLDADAGRAIELAVAAGVLTAGPHGYAFVDGEQGARLAAELTPADRSAILRAAADALAAADAAPERVAGRLTAAGDLHAAAPYLVRAAAVAAGVGAHEVVLGHTSLAEQVEDPELRATMFELRADAAAAMGSADAVRWYREAIRLAKPERVGWLRSRLGRVCLMAGDLEAASEALSGVVPAGGPEDGAYFLTSGMLAYFEGDLERAEELADLSRAVALAPGAPPQLLDAISLQGMISHSRGEWFDRLRRELRVNAGSSELVSTVFDSHVCVAQYLLYGPTTRDEVIQMAAALRATAEEQGSLRAVAFAFALSGEARLLAGDLDGARTDLAESVRIHEDLGAETGRAHALQRLAEVELADGNRAAAEQLARAAVPLARWSPLSRHLLQRAYGTLIAAAPDPIAAVGVVDEAHQVLDSPTACELCQVTISVPSAIALAEAGRLDEAEVELALAERSAMLWDGAAWPAALDEVRAMIARARSDEAEAQRLLAAAAAGFDAAEQPLDAARCREALEL